MITDFEWCGAARDLTWRKIEIFFNYISCFTRIFKIFEE